MEYSLSKILVNSVWRDLLILSDTQPVTVDNPNVIIQTASAGDVTYITTYFTDGLFRQMEDGDRYYNWYLIRSTQTQEIQTNAETVEGLQAYYEQTQAVLPTEGGSEDAGQA